MKKSSNVHFVLFVFIILWNCFFLPAQDSGQAPAFYRSGLESQQSGDYYGAMESFQQALLLNPTYGDAWFHLAQCSFYLDKYDLSLQYADNAAKYAKNSADIQNLRGMTYLALGNFNEARTIFQSILKKYPNNVESRFGLAELDLFSGRLGDAENLYKDALKRQGTNRKALLSLALISAEKGDADLTQNYINQALQFHSGNAEVHFLASYLAAQRGDFEEAEYRIRSSVQIDNNYDEAYKLLADILFMRQKYTDVIDVCDFCISRNRSDSKIWYLKGLALYKQEKNDEAVAVWQTGLSVNPQDEVMRSALELLVASVVPLEDSRRSGWAQYHIEKATAYEKTFAGDSMRFEYQRALKLDPYNTKARTSYAEQLVRDGMNELYLDQLKFIKTGVENTGEKPSTELTDTIEAYESLLQNTLGTKWNVNPFYLDKIRWHLGIYYAPSKVQLQYAESESVMARLLCDMFSGVSAASVDVRATEVSGYADAFRSARSSNLDYFVILSLDETSRELVLNASMYSASSGNKTADFSIFRTGNDRYAIALRLLRRKILENLPIRGNVVAREGKTLLIDLGKAEGIANDAEFDVVRKGEVHTADSGIGLNYQDNSVLGTLLVTRAGEEISEASFNQKGFFDRLNIGDEVVLTKMPAEKISEAATETAPAAAADGNVANQNVESKEEENPLTAESLGLMKTPALIELIRNIRNAD